MIPPMIAPTLADEHPEVEYFSRFLNFNNPVLFEVGEKKFTEDKGGSADPAIFKMFSLNLLEGNPNTALKEANSVAINSTLRNKYFGDKPALGETIEIFDQPFKVVAVFEDFPSHSHFQRNYFLGLDGVISQERLQRWTWSQFHTYVKLKNGTDPMQLEPKLKALAERYAWPEGDKFIPHLMPIEKVHLNAYDQLWDVAVRGNIQTVYILTATAAFILLVAILNFVNLSTARAANRVKEVGVRKVVGAQRSQLINQFISEAILVAFVALLMGSLITMVVLPKLNSFAEKSIPISLLADPLIILTLFSCTLLIGVLAGAYPAFFISAYRPAQILSRKETGRSGGTLLRKGLVVVQFVLSFFLIIASFVVSDQHNYMRNANIGFDKNNLVVLRLRGEMRNNLEATKQAFTNHPNIISASFGYGLPGEAFAGDAILDKEDNNNDKGISMLTVDHDYIKTLGLEIIAGRDFSTDFPTDEKVAFILSEAAAKMLNHNNPEDALGHELAWPRWDAPDSLKEGTVIGVVRDIQLNSMHETIGPVVLHVFPFAFSSITLRIKPHDVPSTIAHLEKTWKIFNSEWPFEYKFLDENFDRMYKSEERLAILFTRFTGFTIFVACLGLFGLVVYSTSQKFREISIRKVFGAAEASLVVLLGKGYLLLITIAFAVAIPLSYYAASQWLQKFAFRIPITPLLFIKAGLFITVIAVVTVGIQSLKAARTNPAEILKEH
jgi:putative ABC transport system permease protein